MKSRKDRSLTDELPRSKGAQYLLEISGEITPERMKGWSQSKNNTQLWMGLVTEARFNAVKSNIAQEPGMLGRWIKANWKWSSELNSPIPVHFSLLIPRMSTFTLAISFDHFQFALIHGPNIPGSCAILLFTALGFTFITSHIHNWVLFLLWLCPFILSGVISPMFSSRILGTYQPGEFIFQCPIFFVFSYCSWGSQDKSTEVVCHSLHWWTTFCQNAPPWPIHLGWPYTAWLIVSLS